MGDRIFSTGAQRNVATGKGRYDLIPPSALRALALRLELGANEHGEYNYMLGIPNSSLYDSAMRHLCQARAGMTDEDHLGALITNVAFLIYNKEQGIGGDVPVSALDASILLQQREETANNERSSHSTN